MDINTHLTLNNGVTIPQLALGVTEMDDAQTQTAVTCALEAGYRHFDTATYYKTEYGIGQAISHSDIPRDEIFITTKLWNDDMRQNRMEEAFQDSLKQLGTDYVDLYLLHWPVAECYVDAWKFLEQLYAQGRCRAIGICNFNPHHIDTLLEAATVVPAVHQFEIHPRMTQEATRAYNKTLGIASAACSPLGTPWGGLLQTPELITMAAQHNCTPAQLVIRWHLQCGTIVLPKSSKPHRIKENCDVFGFSLSQQDMDYLNSLNLGKYIGPDPETFDF